MRNLGWIAVAVSLVSGSASTAFADSALLASRKPTPFDRGAMAISLGAGTQDAFGYSYFGVGAGLGYYVVDGLEVGMFALHGFGDGPSLNQVRPTLTYVAQPLVGSWPLIPYIGGFYKHWFVGSPYEDVDTTGLRAGVFYLNGRILIGLGLAFEHVLSACDVDCDSVYPDVSIGFTF
jgi:hypothetical protein